MTDKPKTIQEALAEVQRKINEERKQNIINEYEAFSGAGQWLADRKKPGDTWYKDKYNAAKDKVSSFLNKPANSDTADYQAAKSDNTKGEPFSSVAQRMSTTPKPPAPAASTGGATPKAEPPKPAGSVTTNDKPTSVVKTKGGDYNVYAKGSEKAADFRKTYAAAKGNFEWEGRKYAKPSSEKPTTSTAAPLPPKRPDDLGKVNAPLPPSRPSDLPKPSASGLSVPTIGTLSGKYNPDKERSAALSFQAPNAEGIAKSRWVNPDDSAYKAQKPQAFDDNRLDPSVTSGNAEFPMSDKFVKTEPKKKVAEEMNPLVAAFLKLQEKETSNMFVEAKKLSKKQDEKLDVVDDDKIDAKDFAALRAGKKKMEEASAIGPKGSENVGPAVTSDNKPVVSPTAPKVDTSVPASDKKALDSKIKSIAKEEVTFSEAELAYFASIDEVGVPTSPTARKTSANDVSGDTVDKRDLTDETIIEGRPKKNPEPETTDRDPRQHIQVMAGRAAAGNVLDFKHENGKTSKLTPGMGRAITAHLNSLKPADRQTAVNKMHASPEGLKV